VVISEREGFIMLNTAHPASHSNFHTHWNPLLLRVDGKPAGDKKFTSVVPPMGGAQGLWMKRALRHLVKASHAVVLVVSCMHAKGNVPGEFVTKKGNGHKPREHSIPNFKAKAVVLFLHGSNIEKMDDTCDSDGNTPGTTVPEVVRQLNGTEVSGLEVVVLAPCSGRATNLGEPIKIEQRVTAIGQTLQELDRAGVDPSRIFLVGHSAGGWAALMHQKRHPGSVNSIIAFAPAFAGKKRSRPDIWQQRHDAQASEIKSAQNLSALVFAFDNDEFNSPQDLAFLSDIKGTTLMRLPEKAIAGVECDIPLFASSHGQAYRKCFSHTQSGVLLSFIRQRLEQESSLGANSSPNSGSQSAVADSVITEKAVKISLNP
jgi:Putative esterase